MEKVYKYMTNLEKYYREKFTDQKFPNWEELAPEKRHNIEHSLGFANWQIHQAQLNFSIACNRLLASTWYQELLQTLKKLTGKS